MESTQVPHDHVQYAATTLYRYGYRCPQCTEAHAAESRERNRAAAAEAFTTEQRCFVLELVAAGVSVSEAAEVVGVDGAWVYARAVWDSDFAKELDLAGWTLCVLGPDHPKCGTATGYRGSVRDDTRPGCRGTGCREWKRESTRIYRTASDPASGR